MEQRPDVPIACTLTPDALQIRPRGRLANELRRADQKESTVEGVRLRFAPDAETLEAIAQAVDAERQCCRFLRFSITMGPEGGPMFLELTGPPGTREFLDALLDRNRSQETTAMAFSPALRIRSGVALWT